MGFSSAELSLQKSIFPPLTALMELGSSLSDRMYFPCFLFPNSPQYLNPAKNVKASPGVAKGACLRSGGWRFACLNVSTRAPRASCASVLHPLSNPRSRRGDKSIPDECKRAGADAGGFVCAANREALPRQPSGRAASQPPAGQGQERPRVAVREASEISTGRHLPGASILGGEKRWPPICSFAIYL